MDTFAISGCHASATGPYPALRRWGSRRKQETEMPCCRNGRCDNFSVKVATGGGKCALCKSPLSMLPSAKSAPGAKPAPRLAPETAAKPTAAAAAPEIPPGPYVPKKLDEMSADECRVRAEHRRPRRRRGTGEEAGLAGVGVLGKWHGTVRARPATRGSCDCAQDDGVMFGRSRPRKASCPPRRTRPASP